MSKIASQEIPASRKNGSTVDVATGYNGPFPICLLPRCQIESSYGTIHRKMCSTLRFIFIQIKPISYEGSCTRTRFQTEAQ